MANIYTVELDGTQYDIQGDRPPTEEDVRSLVGSKSTPAKAPAKQGKSLGGFLSNAATDTGNVLGGFASSLLHPIQTVRTIGSLPLGVGEKAGRKLYNAATGKQGPVAPSEDTVNRVLQEYKGRYGSVKNVGETLYNRPVTALQDLSSLLGIAGGGLKMAGAENAGQTLSNLSNTTNPINIAGKAAVGAGKVALATGRAVGKGVGAIVGNTLGTTTGAGGQAVAEAVNPTQEFLDAMRGKTQPEDVLNNAAGGVQKIRDIRERQFLSGIDRAKNADATFDLQTIKSDLADSLDQFNITIKKNKTLDFKNSPLRNDPSAERAVEDAYNQVRKFKQSDFESLYTLKQQLGNLLPDNPFTSKGYNRGQALVSSLQDSIDSQLRTVPGYSQAMKSYSGYSDVLKQLQRAVGNPADQSAKIQAYDKLQRLFKSDSGLKQAYAGILNEASGGNLSQQVAGLKFSQLVPESGIGKLVASGEVGIGSILALLHNPAGFLTLAGGVPLTIPRVVGEGAAKVGQAAQLARKVSGPVGQAAGQTANAVAPAANLAANPLLQSLLAASRATRK